jgi:hypothetical protein
VWYAVNTRRTICYVFLYDIIHLKWYENDTLGPFFEVNRRRKELNIFSRTVHCVHHRKFTAGCMDFFSE